MHSVVNNKVNWESKSFEITTNTSFDNGTKQSYDRLLMVLLSRLLSRNRVAKDHLVIGVKFKIIVRCSMEPSIHDDLNYLRQVVETQCFWTFPIFRWNDKVRDIQTAHRCSLVLNHNIIQSLSLRAILRKVVFQIIVTTLHSAPKNQRYVQLHLWTMRLLIVHSSHAFIEIIWNWFYFPLSYMYPMDATNDNSCEWCPEFPLY